MRGKSAVQAQLPPGRALMLGMAIRSISWSLKVSWCALAYANACCNPAGAASAGSVYSNAANSIKNCSFALPVTAILKVKLGFTVSSEKASIPKQTAKRAMHVLENSADRSLPLLMTQQSFRTHLHHA
jgi:hypothetical protein